MYILASSIENNTTTLSTHVCRAHNDEIQNLIIVPLNSPSQTYISEILVKKQFTQTKLKMQNVLFEVS